MESDLSPISFMPMLGTLSDAGGTGWAHMFPHSHTSPYSPHSFKCSAKVPVSLMMDVSERKSAAEEECGEAERGEPRGGPQRAAPEEAAGHRRGREAGDSAPRFSPLLHKATQS